jgi:prepilin-type N-terminal cleavage/methylation domain-containing protein
MKTLHGQEKAFTILELMMVVVVLGILAMLALPRMDRDIRQEAADNILSAIRYTQHLALLDDKTDPFDPKWQKKYWTIRFTISATHPDNSYYIITSDMNRNNAASKKESAVDPSNGKYMYNSGGSFASLGDDESPNIFIGRKYGINRLKLSGGCDHKHIAFGKFGRIYSNIGALTNKYESYIVKDCKLTFGFKEDRIDDFTIIISKETGYAYIEGEPGS